MSVLKDSILRSLLERTGGLHDVYNAMDSDDLADVVRAATKALEKTYYLPLRLIVEKSSKLSDQLRTQGNACYVNGAHKQAILLYNKALAYAPRNSLELQMAYSNISAVMLAIKAYQACQMNIKACLKMDCPKFLTEKLNKRMKETYMYINEEMMRDIAIRSNVFGKRFDDVRRNAEVPCASEDIAVQNTEGCKKVVAANDIKAGTMVALERAFVSTLAQPQEEMYTSCYYCHRMSFFFVPCEGCCMALFCSEDCKNKCMTEYHRIECEIVPYMGTMYVEPVNKLMVRAAIKMSLKLSWKELSAASHEIGQNRLKESTVKKAFDASDPVSILSYDDQKAITPGKIFNGSFICASAVHCLESRVANYFPKAAEERKEAMDALSRIMLHLYATFINKIEIIGSAYDFHTHSVKGVVQWNVGWFSFTSKLAHSCEPNMFVLGLNDHVALIALQRINKGEEINISYVTHFYNMEVRNKQSSLRQKMIVNAVYHLCKCRVCVQDWDVHSSVSGTLSPRENKAFEKFKATIGKGTVGDRFNAAAAALDILTGLPNTTQHNMAYTQLRRALIAYQYYFKLNKAYGVGTPCECKDCSF